MSVFSESSSSAKISDLKAILLVAGTCIGGGMLAIPLQTAELGFWVSLLVLFLSWVFMVFTGLLLVEATLWLRANAHFSSLSQVLLGRLGKALSLVLYLFMNVSSLVAYTAGGANLIGGWLENLLDVTVNYGVCCVVFTSFFGGIVYLGISFVSKVNHWFSVLMGISFLYLISLGISKISPEYLVFRPIGMGVWCAFPLILASFSYQMIVPSLCSYVNYNVKSLKKAVIGGTSVAFGIYFLWLLVIHGLIPLEEEGGLREAVQSGQMIVSPLKRHLTTPLLVSMVDGFAFFALTTSYLGLSIAFFDFVYDLFKKKSKKQVAIVSVIPSLLLAIFFPGALIDFLDLSGGFGDALLSGLIPIAMVWVGRYKKELFSEYRAPGGRGALVIGALFFLSVFVFEFIKLFYPLK